MGKEEVDMDYQQRRGGGAVKSRLRSILVIFGAFSIFLSIGSFLGGHQIPHVLIGRFRSYPADLFQPMDISKMPICEKTFVYIVSGRSGFCSEILMLGRFALWARQHNYAFFIESHPLWDYGSYSDYFLPPALSCRPVDGMGRHTSKIYNRVQANATSPHMYASRGDRKWVDAWINEELVDVESLLEEPALDFTRPLPLSRNIRDGDALAFELLYESFKAIWRPVPKFDEMLEKVKGEFAFDNPDRPPIIGLHWRGGDKLEYECAGDCGNATLHLQMAHLLLKTLPPAKCSNCKPILAIMTVEPGVKSMLERDPLADTFDVRLMPPASNGFTGHAQKSFNTLDREVKVESTLTLMRDVAMLSAADGFVVTGSSNIGRFAFTLAGPTKRVASVDVPFVSTSMA